MLGLSALEEQQPPSLPSYLPPHSGDSRLSPVPPPSLPSSMWSPKAAEQRSGFALTSLEPPVTCPIQGLGMPRQETDYSRFMGSLPSASQGFCHWGHTGSGVSPFTLLCLSFPNIKNRHKCFLPWGDFSIFEIAVFCDLLRIYHQKGIKSCIFLFKEKHRENPLGSFFKHL